MTIFLMMFVIFTLTLLFALMVFASRYIRVPPNKAMVVFGHGRGDGTAVAIYTSGGRFIMPIIESWSWLDLSITTLGLSIMEIVTKNKVPIDLELTAEAQIDPSEESLRTAAVMLLNKTHDEIEYVINKTIEGHVRGVCAALEVEDLRINRVSVVETIHSHALDDLKNMGLNIVSLVIRDMRVSGTGDPAGVVPVPDGDEGSRIAELERAVAFLMNRVDPEGEYAEIMEMQTVPEHVVPADEQPTDEAGYPPPPPPDPSGVPTSPLPEKICPTCQSPMVHYQRYSRWWCRTCKRWG